MDKQLPIAMAILGITLGLGMTSSAFILKKAVSSQQAITVKGLAEKTITADKVEWTVSVAVTAPDFAQALAKLRSERPALDKFLLDHSLDKTSWQEGSESVSPHMEEIPLPQGGTRSVQNGFDARQSIVINTTDLTKVVAADKDFLGLQAEGRPFEADSPLYLVSNLEEIKMSLIGAATENARKRANEFTKQDGVHVGVMRSASQGSFYILSASANAETDDYGGVYDKTTIPKVAKVVVTIVYNIEQ